MLKNHYELSRRRFLQSVAAAGTVSLSAGFGAGSAWAADDIVVGFIYVGPRDDYGYNQAHAEGAAALKTLPGVTVIEEENVPETVAVEKSLESMINLDGATLLFPTSFGYFDPHMLKLCEKYPELQFRHCGGLWQEGTHPANAGSYFGYIDDGQYLNGVAAGYASKSAKIGFVAAKPIPQVLRNINAFTLGARSVNPDITTQLIFTGEWAMPVKEAEATNSMIDQGVDVVTCHVDSPKVVMETAERRGAFTCGYHANQAPLAPSGYLTGAEWNWENVYKNMVTAFQNGEAIPNFMRGGIKDGFIKTSPYGEPVTSEARAALDAIKEKMLAGEFTIFQGPLTDNNGKPVLSDGEAYSQTDIQLEQMDWLVEGVIGQV